MKNKSLVLGLLLCLQLFFLFNLQFTAWPEMFSFSYLKNNGFLLYKDMVHPYTPLLTTVLSHLYELFGYKLWVMKSLVWSMSLANSVFIFLIVKKITKKDFTSLLCVFFYILTQPFLEGNMLWPDTALVTPLLAAIYFLEDRKYFLGGLFLATAILIKQTAGLYLLVLIFFLLPQSGKIKKITNLLLAPTILGGLLLVKLLIENSLTWFLNWTLIYPAKYWTQFPGYVQMNLSPGQMVVLIILIFPLIALISWKRMKLLKNKNFILLLLFLGVSIIATYPRFSFFHFQAALAFIVVISCYLLKNIRFGILNFIYFVLIIGVISFPSIKTDWGKEARFYTTVDLKLSEKITQGETIYLLGLPSSYYLFSKSLPPKPWLDNFGWYWEVPQVEAKTISSWSHNPPKEIYSQQKEIGNWYDLGTYKPQELTQWIERNYNVTGVLDRETKIWTKN